MSDWELNGKSRANYSGSDGSSHRNWVTFREFDQALSGLYTENNYPMYTGQFQPPNLSGYQYREIGYTLGLKGYSGNENNSGSNFYTVNNSGNDSGGTLGHYMYATQGLLPTALKGYFNIDFLNGNNNKHAKLANTYSDVKFPTVKMEQSVYSGNNTGEKKADYYVFDSADTTLHLAGSGQLYLKNTGHANWSKNVTSDGHQGGKDSVSNIYGFFPLDDTRASIPDNGSGVHHNYGFGAKIEIPFTLTSDGMTTAKDRTTKIPMIFTFSGDDDIWVEIDGKLVLDMGGDHGRVNGAINFAKETNSYEYVKFLNNNRVPYWYRIQNNSTYVSDVKYVTGISTEARPGTANLSNLVGDIWDGKTHTMTIYYMERGQWESNMRMMFNFVPKTSLSVSKQFIENGQDVTDKIGKDKAGQITNANAKVYAMITYHESTDASAADGSKDKVYTVNSEGTDPVSKYCIELNAANNWKAYIDELPKYINQVDTRNGEYVYTVREVLMDDSGNIVTDGADSSNIGYPKAAVEGSIVKVDGKTYQVKNGKIEGSSTTLINTRVASTELTVKKRFTGTDSTTLPKSVRLRLERTIITEKNSNGDFVIPETIPKTAKWEVVTNVNGVDPKTGWFTLTGTSNTWEKKFEGLQVNPDNDASKGVYVYRVVEATASTGNTAAVNGGTTTATSSDGKSENSYWVYYSGSQNGTTGSGENEKNNVNWTSATSGTKGNDGNYTGATVTLTNQLIVHLPSTGSRTGLTLTFLSLICLAAAGSFGIFGRKRRLIA